MKTRNKKRLITLVLVFALVFLTGAAFAFADGILDIVGTVNISAPDDLYVVWYDVEHDGALQVLHATQTARVENRGGPGDLERTRQRIFWDITFNGADALGDPGFSEAMASITATARNMTSTPSEITDVSVRWINATVSINDDELVPDGAASFNPNDFGLRYTIMPGTITPATPVALGSHADLPLGITVFWDGTVPNHFFNEGGVAAGDALGVGEIVLAGRFVIEFDYATAGP